MYDVIILGAGPGGYAAAIHGARHELKVCVIEKDRVGGTCLNWGCIPTKALCASVKLLADIRKGGALGVEVGGLKLDTVKMFGRKDEVVTRLQGGITSQLKANSIELVQGTARFVDKETVEVNGKKIKGKNIIIATGSSPLELRGMEFDGKTILNSDDALNQPRIPDAILIIGGGVIGCEFAHIYSYLGAKVTIVEMMDQILPQQDKEVAKRLLVAFKKRGIKILTKTKVEKIEKAGVMIKAALSDGQTLEAAKVLISVGRTLNSSDLWLDKAGVKTEKGAIAVNGFLQTNISNIYAIGDVNGGYMLAHVASYEGIIAIDNILGKKTSADYSAVPNCIFTEPEIAGVGMSEEEAGKAGHKVKTAKFNFISLGKAHAIGNTEGFVKIVGDEASGKLLGVTVFGHGATDLIAEAAVAIKLGASVKDLAYTIHAHPTMAEGLMECAFEFLK